ncbi:hypothetical protein PG989_006656 [Apiospora arundinis]
MYLHNLAPGSRTIGSAHRDIKLENILVFPNSADYGSEYDFSLKLTDFDTCTHIQAVSSTSDGTQYNDGGFTYCAPEASRIQERNEHELLTVPLKSDIWSLGVVFSEVIVWLAEGIEGIKAYESRRKQETSLLPGFRGSGFEACFHDGVERLKCVDEVHTEARGLLMSLDDITPLIQRLTETYMLVPADGRLDAKPLFQFFVNEIASLQPTSLPRLHTTTVPSSEMPITLGDLNSKPINAEPRLECAISYEPSSESGSIAQFEVNTTPSHPFWIQNTKETQDNNNQPAVLTINKSQSNDVAVNKGQQLPQITVLKVNSWLDAGGKGTLPGMEEVLQELDGRAQLFVIDDSSSMRRHKEFIIDISRALIAMARKVVPDRVEIVFTSNPAKFIKDKYYLLGRGPNHLVGKIRTHFSKSSTVNSTNMESRMGQILDQVGRSKKPTSVYIMTDGVWQPSSSPAGGLEVPIRNLVGRLVQSSRNRDFVTLQFIQFGHDLLGTERLRYLNDDLPQLEGMHSYDIVDTRKCNDNVPHMLVGVMSSYFAPKEAHMDPYETSLGLSREVTGPENISGKSLAIPGSSLPVDTSRHDSNWFDTSIVAFSDRSNSQYLSKEDAEDAIHLPKHDDMLEARSHDGTLLNMPAGAVSRQYVNHVTGDAMDTRKYSNEVPRGVNNSTLRQVVNLGAFKEDSDNMGSLRFKTPSILNIPNKDPIPSSSGALSIGVSEMAVSDLVALFLDVKVFNETFETIHSATGQQRFVKTVGRSLRTFGRNLRKEASSELQHSIASFVRVLADDIAVELGRRFIRSPDLPMPETSSPTGSRVLEALATSGDSVGDISDNILDTISGDEAEESEPDNIGGRKPIPATEIDAVKEFLLTSNAISSLLINVQRWIDFYRKKKSIGRMEKESSTTTEHMGSATISDPEQEDDIPHNSGSVLVERMMASISDWESREQPEGSEVRNVQNVVSELAYSQPRWIEMTKEIPSVIDRLKYATELYTGEPWDWWPLAPRTISLQQHQVHLVWKCRGLQQSKILSNGLCDDAFYKTLRTEYWGHRGWWRKWFSLYTFQGCDFYKFKCYRTRRYREVLPGAPGDQEGYEYRVEDPPPQISWEEFKDGFWLGPDPAFATDAVQRIPKKAVPPDLQRDLPEFWGIVARQHRCLFRALIYLWVSAIPIILSVWYFFRWLTIDPGMDEYQKANHRDNLSNASVPLMVSIALFTIVLTCIVMRD